MRARTAFLNPLLRKVSRSFYLTVRVLPAAIRPQVGLAYLLARATDTVADTNVLPVAVRLENLENLRQRILGKTLPALDLRDVSPPGAAPTNISAAEASRASDVSPGEFSLLQRLDDILVQLDHFHPADQRRIRDLLAIITSGQTLDLQRFGQAGPSRLIALPTEADLDDYTYRVAGCVGEFWTRMCRAHLFPQAPLDEETLVSEGIRFGKGLQLVNILRDIASDLHQGRCYLPLDQLAKRGLAPQDLLDPSAEPQLRPLYDLWLHRAQAHLQAGWRYTCTLPPRCRRVRLACAWPLLIGLKTIARLRNGPVLNPKHRIKINRSEVHMILLKSLGLLPFRAAWEKQFQEGAPRETTH